MIFDCRQNETARTGRLACTAHKSENQAGLSAHVALPGKGLHALLAVVLRVRAGATAGPKAVLEIPGVRQ